MRKLLLPLLGLALSLTAQAQAFLPSIDRFSGSKPGYLITKSGERIDFILDDLDRKKGLIIRVEGKTTDGKKFKYEAADIQELGLNPSDYAKFSSVMNSTSSIVKAQKTKVSESTRNLVIFSQEHLDDQDRDVLVQLVNPGFDSRIKVFDDPFATQTMGVGVYGMQVTGGMDKSFYVKANGKVFRLKKKNYDEYFPILFGSCPAVMSKYGKGFAWRDFNEHVFLLDQECGGEISAK
ncbi:hypothetical protein [Arsenicibacter rosenii]|uniref:Uncharacterized protein n=1 Tax=Arsenicibacter rosenii TaxID=1750698 RepID=A0A1S2VHC5_9BACT|nr:hypothetical protein [Arsenicibacter rosenii]OIN58144.1 hypothetical protein BLX24_16635 [Arsenicibacter rosenii]